MRKFFTLLTILLVIANASTLVAEVKISGDAKIRPRLDIKDNGEFGNKTSNGYYYYLARLNLKSDIGEGWFGHIQLGSNGYGYFTGKFGDPIESGASIPSSSSVDGASRGPVDFMLVYFGRHTKKLGYMGGLMPVNGITNPMFDLHYYSDKMVDVPYYLYSNNGAYGFSGYVGFENGGKINASIFVDNNDGVRTENRSGVITEDIIDQYTLMLDAPLIISDFTVQPVLLFTAVVQDSTEAPITYGLNISTPKIVLFNFYGSFGISSQKEEGTSEYKAWYIRTKAVGKIGTGTFTAWYDIAKKTFELPVRNTVHDFGYMWLSYTIPVYKSDNGSISIKPTWRHITEKVEVDGIDTKDFVRNKFEVAIDFKF